MIYSVNEIDETKIDQQNGYNMQEVADICTE